MRKWMATKKRMSRRMAAAVLAWALLVSVSGVWFLPPVEVVADTNILELTNETTSGTGWTWDGSTLTLSGATFDKCIWIRPDYATIVLAEGTTNTIKGGQFGSANNHNSA